MARMEDRAKKYVRRIKIQDIALKTLYAGVALTVALTAPNVVKLLRHIDPNFSEKRKASYRLSQAYRRLQDKGLVRKNADGTLTLSANGVREAEKLHKAEKIRPTIPHRWDGLWRVVIFDVWERRRAARIRLREMLKKIGFVKLQESVWIFPYPCEEFIAFVRTELKLGPAVVYLIAQSIENDAKYKRHFGITYD